MIAAQTFRISPLIRITLTLFYIALLLPLPFLAQMTNGAAPEWIVVGAVLGLVALQGALSQQVIVDDRQIQVCYPRWAPSVFVKSWSLAWSEIVSLKMRTTGQGGIVYYFMDKSQQGYLLPMRIAGFAQLVAIVQARTAIDTQAVRPLSQPWMYFMLLGVTLLLMLVDFWSIWTATIQGIANSG
jgi:hypothetical protein